jgi:integrase
MKQIPLRSERSRVPDISPDLFWEIVSRTPEHAQPCYIVLAASGMRLGEYLRCTAADLDMINHGIRVPGTKTAASADTVFVHADLWRSVELAIPAPLQRRRIWVHWKRACRAVGRPELRIHDLRHFFAQIADVQGATTESVMAALRHTNPATTRGYKMRQVRGEVARLVGDALIKRRVG